LVSFEELTIELLDQCITASGGDSNTMSLIVPQSFSAQEEVTLYLSSFILFDRPDKTQERLGLALYLTDITTSGCGMTDRDSDTRLLIKEASLGSAGQSKGLIRGEGLFPTALFLHSLLGIWRLFPLKFLYIVACYPVYC
jgi:hypothetical protein